MAKIWVKYKFKMCWWICFLPTYSFLLHKTLTDALESCELLWCSYQLFRLSFWRHPFTAEDPLVSKWCKFLQICSYEKTLIYILYGLSARTFAASFHFWLDYTSKSVDIDELKFSSLCVRFVFLVMWTLFSLLLYFHRLLCVMFMLLHWWQSICTGKVSLQRFLYFQQRFHAHLFG